MWAAIERSRISSLPRIAMACSNGVGSTNTIFFVKYFSNCGVCTFYTGNFVRICFTLFNLILGALIFPYLTF